MDVEEKRAVSVGLGWVVFASANLAQWVRAKFGAVVWIDVWWQDGGCGVSAVLVGWGYLNAIVNKSEDESGAWAVMKAKVIVLMWRHAEE